MNPFIRWAKFNLVGAMGMAVQLAALALLNRWTAGHYLYASAAAVELALLHNFMWHLHYTWRDRRDGATRLRPFVRFHLSNGLVSMLGNLALMRLLVNETRLPLLVSNVVAILCCSLANFWMGNSWAFAGTSSRGLPGAVSRKDLATRECQNGNSVETGPLHARRAAVGTSDRAPYRAQARTWPA
jgi:putative flippase GtrA